MLAAGDRARAAATRLRAEIAVLVDDFSCAFLKVSGPACVNTASWDNPNGFAATLFGEPTLKGLLTAGAPVRLHYLRDVLHGGWPTGESARYKLAVLLNAHALPAALAEAIEAKLAARGTGLVWVYAAGVLDPDTGAYDDAGVARTTGIAGLRRFGGGPAPLTTALGKGNGKGTGSSYGSGCAVEPAYYYDETEGEAGGSDAVEVLGRYAAGPLAGKASLVRQRLATHTAVFSGSPALSAAAVRTLAAGAGVHLFLPATDDGTDGDGDGRYGPYAGDSVDVAGPALFVHAGERSGVRKVSLPAPARVTGEHGEVVCATPCAGFEATLGNGTTSVFFLEE